MKTAAVFTLRLALALALSPVAPAALPALDLPGVKESHIMIPMRDGGHLSAYLYLPAAEGKWPAVFEQRYLDVTGAWMRQAAADLARAGFAVAMVNYRGTHESEGNWMGYRALGWGQLRDGYDACEWFAVQPWCTGKVGTFGSSQGGFAQNFLAPAKPPHLVAQYMVDTGLSLFQDGYRIGGTTRPERFKSMDKLCRVPEQNEALLRQWDAHPDYDDYWRQEDCSLHFAEMNVPCFTIGSWYDFMVNGSSLSFRGRQHQGGPVSRGYQQLLLGPWLHGRLNKGNKVGSLVFPENAIWPELEHLTRWFNHWLKGEDNGIEKDPAVRYYVMGAAGEPGAPGNVWRQAADWPPAATPTAYYLQADDELSTGSPIGDGRTSYLSDPLHPMHLPGASFPGAKDARPFEEQAEVRTFTTAPLPEPVEWTGEVKAELYVSSTAPDTDFIVRVSDVYPDGRSMLLMDYPQRARYREGFDHEAFLAPGQPAKLSFHVGWTSLIFNRGHRIRVTVSSTGAPLYEPNNQTGGPQTIDWMAKARPAINTVWFAPRLASKIVAPVIKTAGVAAN